MKSRGFEIAKDWEDKDIHMPVRKTKYAAGYDFEAAVHLRLRHALKAVGGGLIDVFERPARYHAIE